MSNVEKECRAAWFKAMVLWEFAGFVAAKIEAEALAEYGVVL